MRFLIQRKMGLQNHLSDLSSESILVLIAVFIGKSVGYLRSRLRALLRSFGFFQSAENGFFELVEASGFDVVGSGLAGLLTLCDQMNLNRTLSSANAEMETDSDCVVCMDRIGGSDHVRKLACRHMFHKVCFDGWLQELNFSCPLCRAPLCPGENSAEKRRRVTADLLTWFPYSCA